MRRTFTYSKTEFDPPTPAGHMDDSLSEAVIPPPLNVRRGQPVDLCIREQRVPSRRGTTSDYALFGGGGGGVGRNRNANTLAH